MSHHLGHRNNCPPRLENALWWVIPLLPTIVVMWATQTVKDKVKAACLRRKKKD